MLMDYSEMLQHLRSMNTVDDDCWRNICDRIRYDAASTVPGAVKMLSIIRCRVIGGENIAIPLIKKTLTYDNVDSLILEHFGSFILSEVKDDISGKKWQ